MRKQIKKSKPKPSVPAVKDKEEDEVFNDYGLQENNDKEIF